MLPDVPNNIQVTIKRIARHHNVVRASQHKRSVKLELASVICRDIKRDGRDVPSHFGDRWQQRRDVARIDAAIGCRCVDQL